MAIKTVNVKGVVHGKIIELEQDSGLPDGQAVSVALRPTLAPGEGLRAAFGAWSEDAQGLDEFVDQLYRDRQDGRTESAE
jgi:hypothetical protein